MFRVRLVENAPMGKIIFHRMYYSTRLRQKLNFSSFFFKHFCAKLREFFAQLTNLIRPHLLSKQQQQKKKLMAKLSIFIPGRKPDHFREPSLFIIFVANI